MPRAALVDPSRGSSTTSTGRSAQQAALLGKHAETGPVEHGDPGGVGGEVRGRPALVLPAPSRPPEPSDAARAGRGMERGEHGGGFHGGHGSGRLSSLPPTQEPTEWPTSTWPASSPT